MELSVSGIFWQVENILFMVRCSGGVNDVEKSLISSDEIKELW
jgi:hypothetical protein